MEKKNKRLLMGTVMLMCSCLVGCANNNTSSKERNNSVDSVKQELTQTIDSESNRFIKLENGLEDQNLIKTGENYPRGNLPINIKGENNEVLLCKDPVYDIVYYVNYGNDNFIYRIKEGKVELAVSIPAKRLFCMDGILYFMVDSYSTYSLSGIQDGNILSYNPKDGKVSVVIDTEAKLMFVYEDGIYYEVDTYLGENEDGSVSFCPYYYSYSFRDKTVQQIDEIYISMYKWNDLYLTMKTESDGTWDNIVGYQLSSLDKSEVINLVDETYLYYTYAFWQNRFYYRPESNQLCIYDIDTKETQTITLVSAGDDDFTIIDGFVYINNLLRIDLETGKQSLIKTEQESQDIYELYTDGKNMYGICGTGGKNYGVLKKIEIIEEPQNALTVQNDAGEEFEIDRYLYRTLPIDQ